jgi:hypothetical protein
VAKRWQLRTWTKGTGATVEPEGAEDRPPVRARPGGLSQPLPTRPWAPAPAAPRTSARLAKHRVSSDARHRHALGYLDEATIKRLETLETDLREENLD